MFRGLEHLLKRADMFRLILFFFFFFFFFFIIIVVMITVL